MASGCLRSIRADAEALDAMEGLFAQFEALGAIMIGVIRRRIDLVDDFGRPASGLYANMASIYDEQLGQAGRSDRGLPTRCWRLTTQVDDVRLTALDNLYTRQGHA